MRIAIPGPAALLALLLIGCGDRPAAHAGDPGHTADTEAATGCLGGNGYLRADLHGAINAALDWHDADMSCAGGLRPDGTGLRITIAGPLPAAGGGAARHLRFLFGIEASGPDGPDHALPTNLTAIVEGEQALYATRGDDKCTIDSLRRTAPDPAQPRHLRIDVRGFCTGPATSIDGAARLLVSRFDFAASYTAEEKH